MVNEGHKCHPNGTARELLWESACGACVSPSGKPVEDAGAYAAMLHLDCMSSRQWLTFVIVATLAVSVVAQEVRSVLKVLVIAAAGEVGEAARLTTVARRAVLSAQATRACVLLMVAGNVPIVVLAESSKTLDVLLNTAAALLLLELDRAWWGASSFFCFDVTASLI